MCSAQQYESNYMQHDLFRDLDLKSNFQVGFFRSIYSSFDTSRRDKRDAGKSGVIQPGVKSYDAKTFSAKTSNSLSLNASLNQIDEQL